MQGPEKAGGDEREGVCEGLGLNFIIGGVSMEEIKISLKYDDGSKEKHEIDSYLLAEALKGFSDFSRTLLQYDNSVIKSSSLVAEIKPGCVEIDFLLRSVLSITEIGAAAIPFVSTFSSVIDLYKNLKGKPPKKIVILGDGNVSVETNSGSIVINQNTYNYVVNNPSIGDACDKFIRKPLKAGVNNIEVKANDKDISAINKSQAESFQKIDFKNQIHEYVSESWLKIIKPVLDGNSRWTFDLGNGPFSADIEDDDFLSKVREGIHKFGNGDYLKVLMRCTQKQNGRKLIAENVIERVLEKKTLENDQFLLLPNNPK